MIVIGGGLAPSEARGAALALGNFDGWHRGHQGVLAAAKAAARGGAPWGAAVFEPHPRAVFAPDAPPFRLMSRARRSQALEALGASVLIEIPFDRTLSLMTPDEFARDVLAQRYGAAHVAVGEGFRFGKDRAGDVEALRASGAAHGFGVSEVAPVLDEAGAVVSSSAVRQALRDGDPERAAALLTRPWVIDGVVERGDQRGRTIGFPTANIRLGDHLHPKFGVYAVTLNAHDGAGERAGVANVGVRPTFGGEEARVEAHVFDFEGDLYGREVAVAFHAFLRAERAFDGINALTAQIARDADAARAVLAAPPA